MTATTTSPPPRRRGRGGGVVETLSMGETKTGASLEKFRDGGAGRGDSMERLSGCERAASFRLLGKRNRESSEWV